MKSSLPLFLSQTRSAIKVAFFGSDRFSVPSLDKLNQYMIEHPEHIESIDVVTRRIKPSGRGLKKLIDLPIGKFAGEHSMNVERADTSSDILALMRKNRFDLAIAVSYGSLIPAKFLQQCTYGGINLHPSLLPRYSGASPIQYALLNDDEYTGVTVQTLHPTKFDGGQIIAQSDSISIHDSDNFKSLEQKLANFGSDLILKIIQDQTYVNIKPLDSKLPYSHAPKIDSSAKRVSWNMSSRSIKKLYDALGPLSTLKEVLLRKKKIVKNDFFTTIVDDIKIENPNVANLTEPGTFELSKDYKKLLIKTNDGFISSGNLKFQYCQKEDPRIFFDSLKKRAGDTENRFLSK